jgi:hypothetical protein
MIRQLRDPDILGGTLLVAFGTAFSLIALGYPLGNMVEMGPGMFPMIIGIMIAILGLVIAARGLVGKPTDPALSAEYPDEPDIPQNHMRAMLIVCISILLFGVTVRLFGLIPAVVVMVFSMRMADADRKLTTTLAIAAALSFTSWLIFILGLNMNIPTITWGL